MAHIWDAHPDRVVVLMDIHLYTHRSTGCRVCRVNVHAIHNIRNTHLKHTAGQTGQTAPIRDTLSHIPCRNPYIALAHTLSLYRLARFDDGGYRKNRLEFTPEHTVPSASLTLQKVPSSATTMHASQSHSVQI